MWPWILGSAALGGLQAYGQSGGDIGKTLTGAAIGGGLGALVPGAGRFAGAALEGSGILTPLASGLTQAAMKSRQLAGLAGPVQAVTTKQLAGLAGTGAKWATGAAIPVVAAGAANLLPKTVSGSTRMASDILRTGGETAGTVAQMTAQEPSGAWNATPPPNLNQWGPDNYATVANPFGSAAAQILRGKLEAQGQLAQLKTLLPYQMEMINKAANADLERQAAGAQMRTRLAQGAQSMLQAQLGAQQLAQQGNQAVLQAAAQRGGYV